MAAGDTHGVRRVCLTGVESTGKSTLAPLLAAPFGGVVLREYGRTYAERNGLAFSVEDLRAIATGHIAARDALLADGPSLIVEDTDIVMTAAWAEMLHGAPDPVLEAIPATADLYLLFDPDMPWVDDGTRLFGTSERRARFHTLVCDQLARRGLTPVAIGGDWEQRHARALRATEACLRAS